MASSGSGSTDLQFGRGDRSNSRGFRNPHTIQLETYANKEEEQGTTTPGAGNTPRSDTGWLRGMLNNTFIFQICNHLMM